MALRTMEGRARRRIDAPAERCREAVADLESWPGWLSGIESVSGPPDHALVKARMVGFPLVLAVALEVEAGGVTLRRLPFEAGDPERFELALALSDESTQACQASVELSARVDLPRLLPLPPGIADRVAGRVLSDLDSRVSA